MHAQEIIYEHIEPISVLHYTYYIQDSKALILQLDDRGANLPKSENHPMECLNRFGRGHREHRYVPP